MKLSSFAVAIVLAASMPLAAPAALAQSGTIDVQQQQMARAQTRLAELGIYRGEVTGQRDRRTERAIERYQLRNNLAVTGTLTPETVVQLFGLDG